MVRIPKIGILIAAVIITLTFALVKVSYYSAFKSLELKDEIRLLKLKVDSLDNENAYLGFKSNKLDEMIIWQNCVIVDYRRRFDIGQRQWIKLKKELSIKDSIIRYSKS